MNLSCFRFPADCWPVSLIRVPIVLIAALAGLPGTPAIALIPEYEFVDIASLAGRNMIPYGVSNDGTIVGQSDFRGTILKDGMMTTLDIPETRLTGINPSGTLCVGTHFDQERERSFVYSLLDGSIRYLPQLGGIDYWTSATGMNDSGLIVGSYFNGGSEVHRGEAFLMQGDTVWTYSAPGAGYTQFGGVNNAGLIAGQWNVAHPSPFYHPFILEGQTLTPLTVPQPLSKIEVTDINNLGQIVGYHTDVSFLLDGEERAIIRYPGGESTRVHGINDYGVIVGRRYEGVSLRGFIAYPKHAIPEPSSLALMLAGAPLVWVRRRR